MKAILCGCGAGSLLILLCWGVAYSIEQEKVTDEQRIRAVLDEQAIAWNKGDLEGFMKGYWKSKDLTFYSGKDKKVGWQETLERYKNRYQGEGKEMGRLTFSELEIQIISTDHALAKGRWKVEMKKESLDGLFTLVMKKFPEGWRIVHDHTSG